MRRTSNTTIFLLLLYGAAVSGTVPALARTCHTELASTTASVSRVIDGDTIELTTGQHVRIVGIDTRELNASHAQDKRWAQQAREAVKAMISDDKNVTLRTEKERKDRHGRLLAHVSAASGQDVSYELLHRGLAIAVAIGANTACANDNMAVESRARSAKLGVWLSKGPWWFDADLSSVKIRGFHVIRTSVSRRFGQGRKSGLRLRNGLKISLGRHWPLDAMQTDTFLSKLEQRSIEVRGWVGGRKSTPTLTLHHPANLRLLDQ